MFHEPKNGIPLKVQPIAAIESSAKNGGVATESDGYHYDKPEVSFNQEDTAAAVVAPVEPLYLPPEISYLPPNSS
jgi:hypothetical protein